METNDYVLFDKANQHIVTDSKGQIIFYADKNEAINDCYGNEIVIRFSELAHDKYGQEVEEFARKCDATGEGMNDGFVVNDGQLYFAYEKDLIEYLRSLGDENFNDCSDELIIEKSYDLEYHYWTEWEDEDEYQYVMINGVLIEKEE